MQPPAKRLDPDLARFCQHLADVAVLSGGATNAVLINANAVRVNLGIPRGGTVLLLRFPAAAVGRDEPGLRDLLAEHQPKPARSIHASAEPADDTPDAPDRERPASPEPHQGQPIDTGGDR